MFLEAFQFFAIRVFLSSRSLIISRKDKRLTISSVIFLPSTGKSRFPRLNKPKVFLLRNCNENIAR